MNTIDRSSAADCQCAPPAPAGDPTGYRRILWIALAANLAMCFVEFGVSLQAGSAALLADAADFLGDSGNYALSLWALSHGLRARAGVALFKALVMIGFGTLVLGRTLWLIGDSSVPDPASMGAVALLALAVNLSVAAMLFRFRGGDANMRSVWLCSRNDAISNLAVLAAAIGVFGTGTSWPDLIVAGVMGTLALTSGSSVLRQALREWRDA